MIDTVVPLPVGAIGKTDRKRNLLAKIRVEDGQLGKHLFEHAGRRRSLGRVAVEVIGRRHVEVDAKWRRHSGSRQKLVHQHLHLADLAGAVDAGRRHAVAAGLGLAGEMIALIGGDDEQRVGFVDALSLQLREERGEALLVLLELCDETGSPGP